MPMIPTFATVKRTGDTISIRTKLPDADPTSVRAQIIDGELFVTVRTIPTQPGSAGIPSSRDRYRLIDLGPKLRPTASEAS